MTQEIVVALIVALAALYAVWRWMPAPWRRAAAAGLAAGSQRAGLVDAQRAEALAASLAKSSGCGACDSCGACTPKSAPSSEPESGTPATRLR
ncbi:DUF6587 family protein [Variovorax sp. PBL-E5]|uniref:DUF6587 family protein n=1 Tax=Variovorax sp. PBL-E5 TaxID=434014 RepID=UPI001319AF23|nr:DUF6587 family protein [Variovorax sp. PBL-E5]VTU34939.1 hypothetical protein E5CHR_03935 [Variovorax sp. PBL-E5]